MTSTYNPLDYTTHPLPRPGYRWDRWLEREVRIERPLPQPDDEDDSDWRMQVRDMCKPEL